MMRLIPGKTKVQIEMFKGVTLADMIIGGIAGIMLIFVLTSSLPGKLYITIGVVFIAAMLLVRLDAEPNYKYLLHILRHVGYRKRFERTYSDQVLIRRGKSGKMETAFEEVFTDEQPPAEETKEQRKERLKAEKAERKADDKILKSKTATKEEQDAIWLKRAHQDEAKKQRRKEEKAANARTYEMEDIVSFTGIKDGFIEYAGKYYGTAIEIPPVEFRFFSAHRRNNAIENALGRVLRSLPADYAANIVKIERPIIYDEYLENEYQKLDALKAAYEKGVYTEEELQSRVEVLYDRIAELQTLCSEGKVLQPFYYVVLFDSDRQQLMRSTYTALDDLRNGEMNPKLLKDRELAVFLKYTTQIDFDEHDIDKIAPEDYAAWAMPRSIQVTPRTVRLNGIITHNMRIVNYPSTVGDAWLAGVLSMPSTKVVIKCQPMDRNKSIRAIDHSLQELRGQYRATGVDSKLLELQEHIDTLDNLLSMLQGDNETLLDVNVYVTAYDINLTNETVAAAKPIQSDLANITNLKRVVRRLYNESNIRLNNMEFNQMAAFIGSQISAWDPMHKEGRGIPSNSLAACFPWIYAHISDEKGVKLGVSDGVPVFIDFFRRDSERVNSNMVIVGKSGSGKSYATKSLLTNLAADDSKIFILDPENEYTELAKNLHGKFINVGNAQFGRLNPFQIITALDDDEEGGSTVSGSYATHLQFLEEFFRQILPDCEKDAMEYLNSLIDRMYTNMGITAETDLRTLRPEDYPIFDDLYDAILTEFQTTDNEYIHSMLRTLMNYVAKFSSGGRNANIWNGPSTVTTDENFTVFNFQSLLANRNGTIANAQMLLVLKYIDNEIIKNRDYNTRYKLNRKIVVVIDEAHVFIDDKYPVALDFMFQLAKRIRKYNGMQIVITQNIKDFVGSEEIARKSTAIINACQYSFIFSLAPNDMDDLCRLYEKAGGINENEGEQIVTAPRGQAFTVMSPQSRSTFKISVPEGMVAMFKDPDYTSSYFSGVGGDENWEAFIGDSREKRALVKSIMKTVEDAEQQERRKQHITFMEVSEEELAASTATASAQGRRKTPAPVVEEEDDFPDIPDIPDDPAEFMAAREAEKAAPVQTAPVVQPAPVPAAAIPAPVVPQVVVQAPAASSQTEQMLGELLGRFSYDTMLQEIRRSVREEMDREMGSRPSAQPVAAAEETEYVPAAEELETPPDEETAEDDTFFGLFDEDDTSAASDDEDEHFEPEAEAASEDEDDDDDDDDDDGFDIMELLAMEAKRLEGVSPIDMMEAYDQTTISISLEELMQYNAKH